MKVQQNISRLKYLLNLYKISEGDFLAIISKGLKKPLTAHEVFTQEVKLDYLKRIDKVFNKGLSYYLDPKNPVASPESSIFFRKQKFGTDLNLGAKKIVNRFEELKISLAAFAKLSEIEFTRTVKVFTVKDDPKTVASELRKQFYPRFKKDAKNFLEALVSKMADQNILVFEFVETHNQIEKANIDGFFLKPNVIVLKRQAKGFSREIFTLCHELGHYLLNEEEIEQFDVNSLANKNLSTTEKWCNDFAYYFMAGSFADQIDQLEPASSKNDYHFELVGQIKAATHLSRRAIFTRLLFQEKITRGFYSKVSADLDAQFREAQEKEAQQRELAKQEGLPIGGAAPVTIKSPLLVSTIQKAFFDGVISEYEACKKLGIKPDKFQKFIS